MQCNHDHSCRSGRNGPCDWAEHVVPYVLRWAERKGFSLQVLDYLDGDITGMKELRLK